MIIERVPAPLPRFPCIAYEAWEGEHLIAGWGLAWIVPDGERKAHCWLGLDAKGSTRHPVILVRWARRMLKTAVQLGESEVFTTRDADEVMSERLLKLLGFEFVRVIDGIEVHRWRALQH